MLSDKQRALAARKFRRARLALNMSQSQLAEAMGLTSSAIRMKEYGHRPVTARDLKMLAMISPAEKKRGPGNPNIAQLRANTLLTKATKVAKTP